MTRSGRFTRRAVTRRVLLGVLAIVALVAPEPSAAQTTLSPASPRATRLSPLRREPGARSGSSPPPSTIASTPIPIRSVSARRSTGSASSARRASAIFSKAGAPSPILIAASPATPTVRPGRSTRPMASMVPWRRRALEIRRPRGYRDPACDFRDAPFNMSTPHGTVDQRQSACDLRFGTSTGALGLRKFPTALRRGAMEKLNGGRRSWDGYRALLSGDAATPDARVNRLFDGSIEPPFRIGMACGACHIAYDPLKPPADPSIPHGRASTASSATSTAACRRCSARACRSTASNGSSSRGRGRARSIPRRCRWIPSPIPAR